MRSYISSSILAVLIKEEARSIIGRRRNRVHLAMTLKMGANVLLLDEPTKIST